MKQAIWIAVVVVILAVIGVWMWFYRAPPAVPHEQGDNGTVSEQVEGRQD